MGTMVAAQSPTGRPFELGVEPFAEPGLGGDDRFAREVSQEDHSVWAQRALDLQHAPLQHAPSHPQVLARSSPPAPSLGGGMGLSLQPPRLSSSSRSVGPLSPGAGLASPPPVVASEPLADCSGGPLGIWSNVTLLAPGDAPLRVRGQIVGTYWEQRTDIGPQLRSPGEVQVLVTFVEPGHRSVPLLHPTERARTFGDTETADGNVIRWEAALCRIGKKFTA